MKPKPSGAQLRKRQKEKDLIEIDLDKAMKIEISFDSETKTTKTQKNQKPLKERFKDFDIRNMHEDLRNLRAYRDGGYNVTGIQSANEKRASESAKRKAEILSKYSPENYPNKKSMYQDISIKEDISIHTAIKYFTK